MHLTTWVYSTLKTNNIKLKYKSYKTHGEQQTCKMFSSSSSPVILLISGRISGAEVLPNTILLYLVETSNNKNTCE